MTHDEILQGLYDHTLVGHAPEVKDLVNAGLADGMDPESMLYDALIPSLEEVGARFERGDFFVPEMLIAARAMQGALDILRPLLAETGAVQVGTYVMGTVKGDVHDIGKNLVNIMLEGAGFTVHDLGVNVAPEKFIEAIQEHKPDIVGFSAFLTTTMPMFKANINALEKAGIRDDVIVMVGGAPVTQAVRGRGRRRRLRGGRVDGGAARQGPDPEAPLGGSRVVDTVIRSPSRTVTIGPAQPFCVIGERINPTGRKAFQAQLQAGDLSQIEIDVAQQVAGGADMLDVNVGDPLADEVGLMAQAIPLVQGLCDLPLCIDSSVIEALGGRSRRVRREGARQLRHRRGLAARGDPADRRAPRRSGDRARQRRGHPDGAGAAGSRWRRRSSPPPATTASRPRT